MLGETAGYHQVRTGLCRWPGYMSMNAFLRRVPAGSIVRVRADEALRDRLMGGAGIGGGDLFAGMPWYVRWPLRALMKSKGFPQPPSPAAAPPPPPPQRPAEPDPGGELLNLHKSWHALHWLICEDPQEGPEPLRYALFGVEEVGEDLGYGPAQLSAPEDVARIAAALRALEAAQILGRYNPQRMEELEIYPGGWASDRSWRRELERDYGKLRDFYERAARDKDGVLTWMS